MVEMIGFIIQGGWFCIISLLNIILKNEKKKKVLLLRKQALIMFLTIWRIVYCITKSLAANTNLMRV